MDNTDDMTAIDRSNSLVDLAARIKIEHEAATDAMARGAEHAIKAGELLIEAKEQLKHGQWLPWLREHCEISSPRVGCRFSIAICWSA